MKRIATVEYLLLIEAWIFLALARVMLVMLPFKKIAPLLGQAGALDLSENKEVRIVVLRHIKVAVARACRFSPWRTKCFEQAIAAKIMAKRRHIKSTLFLGVFKDTANKLCAHAWLKIDNIIITGGPDISHCTVVSRFDS